MAKKSLGQNFLQNHRIIEQIVDLADVVSEDLVIEVGPGRGALTTELARAAGRLIAFEKDDELAAELVEKFADQQHVQIVHGDILAQDLSEVIPDGAKVVANLPYNIGTEIITRFAAQAERLSAMVFMVQKEVGERICAEVGSKGFSTLSVLVGSTCHARAGFIVGPQNFRPRPKVDSMVLRLDPKDDPFIPTPELKRLVHQSFGQRRKMLRNSWLNLQGVDQQSLDAMAAKVGISLDLRPQNLSVEQFQQMSLQYKQLLDSQS